MSFAQDHRPKVGRTSQVERQAGQVDAEIGQQVEYGDERSDGVQRADE